MSKSSELGDPSARRRAIAVLRRPCVILATTTVLSVGDVGAQTLPQCEPSREGYESCRLADDGGAVDIERAVPPGKMIVAITMRPGRENARLSVRALELAFASHAVPNAARAILENALAQCLRSGAEITTRIGAAEWMFAREAPYACVLRITP